MWLAVDWVLIGNGLDVGSVVKGRTSGVWLVLVVDLRRSVADRGFEGVSGTGRCARRASRRVGNFVMTLELADAGGLTDTSWL